MFAKKLANNTPAAHFLDLAEAGSSEPRIVINKNFLLLHPPIYLHNDRNPLKTSFLNLSQAAEEVAKGNYPSNT